VPEGISTRKCQVPLASLFARRLRQGRVVLAAEFIAETGNLSRFPSADALAAAAGIAPLLRQSGKTRFLRRPAGGNKALKRVFYQSAFCSLAHPDSRTFYERKRREGKRHHQAVIALARRRIDVLWAMLQNRQAFRTNFKLAAWLKH
jgi:transposase